MSLRQKLDSHVKFHHVIEGAGYTPGVAWRRYVIDIPARITEVGLTVYRLYMMAVLLIAGPGLLLMVLTVLVLYFGFGVRWGW